MTLCFYQDIRELLTHISPTIFHVYNRSDGYNDLKSLNVLFLYIIGRLLVKHYKLQMKGFQKQIITSQDNSLDILYNRVIKEIPDLDINFKHYINYHSMMYSHDMEIRINNTTLEFYIND